MTYFYGGSVKGRVVEATRPARVSITNSVPDAALLALVENGHVCEVHPIGKVTPDRDGEPGISFCCKRAKIVRILSWSEVRAHLKIRIAHEQQAQDTQEPVRQEDEIQG